MPFVVDASVSACWLLPDETQADAERALSQLATDHAIAPSLWWFEIRNVLVVNERRGRLDRARTTEALALLSSLPIVIDRTAQDEPLLRLARRHGLTIYDAAYLELAQRQGVALATLDDALITAARAEQVSLFGALPT